MCLLPTPSHNPVSSHQVWKYIYSKKPGPGEIQVKLSLYAMKNHAMKTCGVGGYSSTISALDGGEPLPLYPQGKTSRHPLHRRLGGPKSRSGRCGEEINYLPTAGIELRSSSPSLIFQIIQVLRCFRCSCLINHCIFSA
jgi:hypothetical protein